MLTVEQALKLQKDDVLSFGTPGLYTVTHVQKVGKSVQILALNDIGNEITISEGDLATAIVASPPREEKSEPVLDQSESKPKSVKTKE